MGISDMITSPGLINVDFADVRTVMSEMGQTMIGSVQLKVNQVRAVQKKQLVLQLKMIY